MFGLAAIWPLAQVLAILAHLPLVAMEEGPAQGKLSIAAACAQGSGHLLPILNICTELSKRGHKVKVYMPDFDKENTEKLTRKSGSEFVPLDSQGNTEEGMKEKANQKGTNQFLLWEEIMLPAMRSEFSKSLSASFDIRGLSSSCV